MKILHIAVSLFVIHTLGVCEGQEACLDVQQKLQVLSEAVQTLCGSSTPSPTTAQPAPVMQQCDYSPAVNCTSVTMISVGYTTLRLTGTLAYDILSVIPTSAKEVLVFVNVRAGRNGPTGSHYVKIYTEQNQKQYEKYIVLYLFNNNALVVNSDNPYGFR